VQQTTMFVKLTIVTRQDPLHVTLRRDGIHWHVSNVLPFVLRIRENHCVELISCVLDGTSQSRLEGVLLRFRFGEVPDLIKYAVLTLTLLTRVLKFQSGQDRVAVSPEGLGKLPVHQGDPALARHWIERVSQEGVEKVGPIHTSRDGLAIAVPYLFNGLFVPPPQLCPVRQQVSVVLGEARRLEVDAHRSRTWTCRAMEVEGSQTSLVRSISGGVLSIIYKVVQRILGVLSPTESRPSVLEVDNDVDVPVTLGTIGCDFVGEAAVVSGDWQHALLVFPHKRMSAVVSRHRGPSVLALSELGRGASEEVAASFVFAARVVCKEIL
jgi:hypothetical protein